jgi:hypothetical protein
MNAGPDTKMIIAGVIISVLAALELYPRWRSATGGLRREPREG